MSDDKKDAMPAWPNSAAFVCVGPRPCHECEARYQRALREAWETRCRVAVEALAYAIAQHERPRDFHSLHNHWAANAHNAINAIGPLPELPPSSERG